MRKLGTAAAGVLSVVLAAACEPTAPASPGEARTASGSATPATAVGTSEAPPPGGAPVSPADARARDAQRHARDRGERDQ